MKRSWKLNAKDKKELARWKAMYLPKKVKKLKLNVS